MKHIFIINPAAGKRDQSVDIEKAIKKTMEQSADPYEIIATKYPRYACEVVKNAASREEYVRIYACGGDGTLNEVVCGATGLKNVEVAHYPCGTGNDFIRIFGEDAKRFYDLSELVFGETVDVDVIESNIGSALNVCSAGYDARIANDVKLYRKWPLLNSKGKYMLSLIRNTIRPLGREYKVTIDGDTFEDRYTLVLVANGRYYGGGFYPVPIADPGDGDLDVLLVKEVSRLSVAKLLGLYMKGQFDKMPEYIRHLKARKITIENSDGTQMPINLDGEIMFSDRADIKLCEQKVKFAIPRSASWAHVEKKRDIQRKPVDAVEIKI